MSCAYLKRAWSGKKGYLVISFRFLSFQTTVTKTVILETDTHCYKTFPLAKPCKGKGSGKGLKDKFKGKGKGRALWIDAGPIVGKDGSITVASEAEMNSLIKPTKAKAKGDEEENLPQVCHGDEYVHDAMQ